MNCLLWRSRMCLVSLPPDYETGYVDSLSNRSHSRTNGHDLNVGFNYSDDTWMVNASLGITPQRQNH